MRTCEQPKCFMVRHVQQLEHEAPFDEDGPIAWERRVMRLQRSAVLHKDRKSRMAGALRAQAKVVAAKRGPTLGASASSSSSDSDSNSSLSL